MAVNKVIKGNTTLIDLTADTAVASDVASGKTFHLADGTQATGSAVPAVDNLPAWLSGNTITAISDSAITAIRDYAAYHNGGLLTVSLPTATSIGECAFQYCKKMTSFSAPSATSLSLSALDGWSKLATVDLTACYSLAEFALSNCGYLTMIALPALGDMGVGAFAGCYSLEEVYLGGNFGFFYPASSASEAQFYDCGSLQRLIIAATTPPTMRSAYLFGNVADIPVGLGIYVPDAAVNDYKAATNWSVYASYIHPISDL